MGTINMYDDSSTLIDNNVLNNESIYDILNATVDEGLMKGVAESMLEFKDSSSIILYTSLNKTNTQLLMQDKYNELIFAHEYLEASLGIKQSEFIIKFSYNTNGLYDTLHPKAYNEIQQIIKNNLLITAYVINTNGHSHSSECPFFISKLQRKEKLKN